MCPETLYIAIGTDRTNQGNFEIPILISDMISEIL